MNNLPLKFLAIYACTECGHELELENCYIDEIHLPCEECRESTLFKVVKITHGISF